ncbi:toll/interleukin-1 receptor domain-containing protein [Croceiramulus getboli]|nr:toll/interleukin-1 receptor domain-containing protein [Flavobacteriaceae bacterium YJPT1-3]
MHDLFLSYSKSDLKIAKKIAQALEKEGIDVWWDHDIATGDTWDTAIEKAIDSCRCVVVLWSPSAVDSEWVRIEAAEGKKRNILIPVRIIKTEVPLAFRRRQYSDLIQWSGNHKDPAFLKLVNDIKQVLQGAKTAQQDLLTPASKTESSYPLKKKQWTVIIGALLLITVFVLYFQGQLSFPSTSAEKTIPPIDFNASSNALPLVFESATLSRKDTFYIDRDRTVNFLKEAIERHYQFSQPPELQRELGEGGIIQSVLYSNQKPLRNESLSLEDAGIEPYALIQFNYQLIVR